MDKIGFSAKCVPTKEVIEALARMALQVPLEDVHELIREYRRIETVGPIVDPTAYRDVMKTIGGHEDLGRAFLEFRLALEKHRPPEGGL